MTSASYLEKRKMMHRSPRGYLPIVRNFCPDLLADLLLHLDSVLKPDVILTGVHIYDSSLCH